MGQNGRLVLLLGVAVLALVVANAAANKLSKPLEANRLWRDLLGR